MNTAVIALALELILKYAPSLFVQAALLFAKGDPTPEQIAAFNDQLVRLMNPQQYYTDAQKSVSTTSSISLSPAIQSQ